MAVIDWTDACARAAALREAYYNAVQGGGETSIRYRGPNGERHVTFGQGNMESLLSELRIAEQECAASTGTLAASRRFSIRGGALR